ncbi:hypothetical protein SAMD00019534_003220 [Acytostelium subglobosum LB1]|uniref:hypothetical protein n=1 Tax=Acytostelium subglobosum LB1 TaxID=1410327 RepID=UPI000644C82A|nr:hypothetical protein SAMD00019534_003220 [Acytostelium subglobosum LB1]GAM17147.1 hypothetical protein SAMD00019534_003220 [Acytostelium subglobosum LB1]|eukprot:XP_012759209.1 hypothetical protein SAMD00019534_003220 [Acytostelium subglobosum LB1]
MDQFERKRKVRVDPAIIEDIFTISNGHAGLTNLCGRVLDNNLLTPTMIVELDQWQQFKAHSLVPLVLSYPTVQTKMEYIMQAPDEQKMLLLQYVRCFPHVKIFDQLDPATTSLISQGFLQPNQREIGGQLVIVSCVLKSQLLRNCILSMLGDLIKSGVPDQPFPSDGSTSPDGYQPIQ